MVCWASYLHICLLQHSSSNTMFCRGTLCFVRLAPPLSFCVEMRTWLSSWIVAGYRISSSGPLISFRSHNSSLLASANMAYSTSVEDNVIHSCVRDVQLIVQFYAQTKVRICTSDPMDAITCPISVALEILKLSWNTTTFPLFPSSSSPLLCWHCTTLLFIHSTLSSGIRLRLLIFFPVQRH